MDDDLNRQDTLQWIYGSKELKKQPLPIAVKDDNVPMEKVMAPSLPVNALQESGSYFNDGGSNVKINNQMICYSVLHVVDHSLPKVSCNVCNNSFHSACLYKWFSNANKSTCPLCRSEF